MMESESVLSKYPTSSAYGTLLKRPTYFSCPWKILSLSTWLRVWQRLWAQQSALGNHQTDVDPTADSFRKTTHKLLGYLTCGPSQLTCGHPQWSLHLTCALLHAPMWTASTNPCRCLVSMRRKPAWRHGTRGTVQKWAFGGSVLGKIGGCYHSAWFCVIGRRHTFIRIAFKEGTTSVVWAHSKRSKKPQNPW